MDAAGLTIALAVEGIRLVRGTAQRVRQVSANRESVEFLAMRLVKLETSLTAAQRRNAKQPDAWNAAVKEMMEFLNTKVSVFLDGMEKRTNVAGLQRVRLVGKANWEADNIKLIERRLDVFVQDLSLQLNAAGFVEIGERVDHVKDKMDGVGENVGVVLQRLLVLEQLVAANTAAKARSAEDFLQEVAVLAEQSRERNVRPAFGPRKAAPVGGSAPAPALAKTVAFVDGGAPEQRPAVQPLDKATEARVAEFAARSAAAANSAKPSDHLLAAHMAVGEMELPQEKPGRTSSGEGLASPGSTVTSEMVFSKEIRNLNVTGGSDGAGGTVEGKYLAMAEMRQRLEPQVQGLLSSVGHNPLLQMEVSAIQKVVRELWEPWSLSRDRIVYERTRKGAKKLLGTGGYGRVYKASLKSGDDSMESVAVKELDGQYTNEKFKADFKREADLMHELSHPCVISFYGASWLEQDQVAKTPSEGASAPMARRVDDSDESDDDDEGGDSGAILVTERMSCNLQKALNKGWLKGVPERVSVMRDVAEGMVYLHSKRVVHMDLKLENILCRTTSLEGGGKTITGRAKITDFGVSQTKRDTCSRTMTRVAGTKVGFCLWDGGFADSTPARCLLEEQGRGGMKSSVFADCLHFSFVVSSGFYSCLWPQSSCGGRIASFDSRVTYGLLEPCLSRCSQTCLNVSRFC